MKYSELFLSHVGKVSHKWTSYLYFYDGITERLTPDSILEIGVQNGGSLEIWAKKYPRAKLILGLDNDPKCGELVFDSESVKVIIGDASSDEMLEAVLSLSQGFDLIVDDGSHKSTDIINSLVKLLPLVRPGGIYVVEDLHASYWASWGGGLAEPLSAMNFLKRLADIVNIQHWGTTLSSTEYLEAFATLNNDFVEALPTIKSISFENSICWIQVTDNMTDQLLGNSVVTGRTASVFEGIRSANGALSQPELSTVQSSKMFELVAPHRNEIAQERHAPSMEKAQGELASSQKYLLEKSKELNLAREALNVSEQANRIHDAEIRLLNLERDNLAHEVLEMKQSRSWRWTALMRRFGRSA